MLIKTVIKVFKMLFSYYSKPIEKAWHPMTEPIDIKHLGKLGEELGECSSAAMRCLIQGIDECDPVSRKLNRRWLEEELADVLASSELAIEHFKLDQEFIQLRKEKKKAFLSPWHAALKPRNDEMMDYLSTFTQEKYQ